LLALVHARADGVRQRRQRFRFLGLGTAAVVTLMAGITAAAADSGTSVSRPLARAAEAPADAAVMAPETTTTIEATTTTTIGSPVPVVAAVPTTTTPTTTAPPVVRASAPASTSAPHVRPTVRAFLTETSRNHHDPGRIYVSAQGDATGGYVSSMILKWGDGSPARIFSYPSSSCQAPGGGQPHDIQVADDNHAYPAPASYTVQLTVVATTCDGAATQTEQTAIRVTYPSTASG
jgi:hypothetical protein